MCAVHVHASDRNGEVDGPWACHLRRHRSRRRCLLLPQRDPLRQGPFDGGFAGSTAAWQEGQRSGRAAQRQRNDVCALVNAPIDRVREILVVAFAGRAQALHNVEVHVRCQSGQTALGDEKTCHRCAVPVIVVCGGAIVHDIKPTCQIQVVHVTVLKSMPIHHAHPRHLRPCSLLWPRRVEPPLLQRQGQDGRLNQQVVFRQQEHDGEHTCGKDREGDKAAVIPVPGSVVSSGRRGAGGMSEGGSMVHPQAALKALTASEKTSTKRRASSSEV